MQRAGVLLVVAGVALASCSTSGSGAGGTGGTGGIGGSGGSSAGSTYCDQFAQLACNPFATTADCLLIFNKVQAEAAQAGCTSQWNAAVDCITTHPDTCNSGQAVADPSCKTALESYLACNPSAECKSSSTTPDGGATNACTGTCGDASVSCQITGTTASCTCTAGAHSGTSFTSTDASPCQGNEIYIHCK